MEKSIENGLYVPFGYVLITQEEYAELIRASAAAKLQEQIEDYKKLWIRAADELNALKLKEEFENAE